MKEISDSGYGGVPWLSHCGEHAPRRKHLAETAAGSGLALNVERGLVARQGVLDDREPETGASGLARATAVDPIEPLRQPRKVLRFDAEPVSSTMNSAPGAARRARSGVLSRPRACNAPRCLQGCRSALESSLSAPAMSNPSTASSVILCLHHSGQRRRLDPGEQALYVHALLQRGLGRGLQGGERERSSTMRCMRRACSAMRFT